MGIIYSTMDDAFLDKIIRLLSKGIKGSRLESLMIRNVEKWDGMSREDIELIIDTIKFNQIALYSFLPFCYKYLGVNLFTFYVERSKELWLDPRSDDIITLFEKYPIEIHEFELEYLEKKSMSLDSFNSVRLSLLKQGFDGVDKVKVCFKNQWIFFEKDIKT